MEMMLKLYPRIYRTLVIKSILERLMVPARVAITCVLSGSLMGMGLIGL